MNHVPQCRWLGSQLEKRLARKRVAPDCNGILERLFQFDDHRRKNASRDRQEVRREHDVHVCTPCRQRGAHLVQVPVRVTHAVCPKILRDFREEQLTLRRIARSTYTARGADLDDASLCEDIRCDRWSEREQHGGRIASGVRNDVGGLHAIAHQLAEPVGYTLASIAGPKIARQIHHPRAVLARHVYPLL